jgi:transposase
VIQGCILWGDAVLGERIGVSDEEWTIIGALLPPERGRWARPAHDNRRYFEGMLWIARTGSQWRQLPDEYGKWNSVFRRFRRWTALGVFDALVESLSELVERERSADMVDTTIVRAHHCTVGLKRGLRIKRPSAARAVASRQKSTLAATARAGRSASSSRQGKRTTIKGS